jgi:adenine-specific DNA methylase
LDYKIFVLLEKLMNNNIESLDIFDDRQDHIIRFVEFGKNLKEKFPNLKSVIVHDVIHGKNYPI